MSVVLLSPCKPMVQPNPNVSFRRMSIVSFEPFLESSVLSLAFFFVQRKTFTVRVLTQDTATDLHVSKIIIQVAEG